MQTLSSAEAHLGMVPAPQCINVRSPAKNEATGAPQTRRNRFRDSFMQQAPYGASAYLAQQAAQSWATSLDSSRATVTIACWRETTRPASISSKGSSSGSDMSSLQHAWWQDLKSTLPSSSFVTVFDNILDVPAAPRRQAFSQLRPFGDSTASNPSGSIVSGADSDEAKSECAVTGTYFTDSTDSSHGAVECDAHNDPPSASVVSRTVDIDKEDLGENENSPEMADGILVELAHAGDIATPMVDMLSAFRAHAEGAKLLNHGYAKDLNA